jgi:hypothetical protein
VIVDFDAQPAAERELRDRTHADHHAVEKWAPISCKRIARKEPAFVR